MADGSISILVDHDIEGFADALSGALNSTGWLEMVTVEFFTFARVGLATNATDRAVWRFAQAHQMILLTNNRNMKGSHSLEMTLREENGLDSLLILTIGNVDRLAERAYREQCADAIVETILFIENHKGRGRVYIP